VVELLPSKHKALSLNLHRKKKEKEGRKEEEKERGKEEGIELTKMIF
jgi:hypothetical protein